jgi:hypothetical protein
MPINWSDGTVTHEGRVLATEFILRHVSSGNAMLDSGEDTVAKVWEGGRIREVLVECGWPMGNPGVAVIDATAEVVDLAAKFSELRYWISGVVAERAAYDKRVRESKELGVGRKVIVTRGRKAPLGTMGRMTACGRGMYGEFVDLDTGHRYVNPDNLVVIPDDVAPPVYKPFRGIAVDNTMVALLQDVVRSWRNDDDDTPWKLLHDYVLDTGVEVPSALVRAAGI